MSIGLDSISNVDEDIEIIAVIAGKQSKSRKAKAGFKMRSML